MFRSFRFFTGRVGASHDDHEALTISQNGSWGLSRPYHVALVVALMVVSVLRLLWVLVG